MAQVERDRQIIQKLFSDKSINKVIDISSGTGFVAKCFTEMGADQVVASDITDALLREGKSSDSDIHWVVCDAEHLSFKVELFDAATCRYSFHHYPDPGSAIIEVHKALRDSGLLLLVDPTPPPGEPQRYLNQVFSSVEKKLSGHNKFYTSEELEKIAEENGFQVVKTIKHSLKTQLLQPAFRGEFDKIPIKIKKIFEIKYGAHKGIDIKIPVTSLLFHKKP